MTRLLTLLAALAALAALALAVPSRAQPAETATAAESAADTTLVDPDGHFAVFAADGTPADPASGPGQALDAVVQAAWQSDVVFLGEQHDDPVAHALQRRLLEDLAEHAASGRGQRRPVALALEMFERDVQLVLDEYLAGLIRERDFLAAARPWSNYATDYRPLVEYAKAHGIPVVAANAPGRYVSRVGREGESGLDTLSAAARALLPPLPLPPPSEAYAARFRAQMEAMGGHGHNAAASGMPPMDHLLAAQNLRDVAMAHAIARRLDAQPGALVVHVNGSFHSEGGLGVPEQLVRLRPGTRTLVVTLQPAEDIHARPTPTGDAFVIRTDAALRPERTGARR